LQTADLKHRSLSTLSKWAFWVVAVAILALALAPVEILLALPNDKLQHFFAFLILTGLGRLAWGQRRLLIVNVGTAWRRD
jgi:hypothetical protein